MWEVLEDEYKMFLDDMKRGETICRYIDETDYEDEYSHNEIDECQEIFIGKVREWLHKNKPNQYIVSSGWCVFVMTKDEAEKRKISNAERYLVE